MEGVLLVRVLCREAWGILRVVGLEEVRDRLV